MNAETRNEYAARACVSTYGEPEGVLGLYLSIPYEIRVAILSAILLAEVIFGVAL